MTVTVEWILGVIGAFFLIMVKIGISRYFKYLDTKEYKADKRNEEVTKRLDCLNTSITEMSIEYKHIIEKVDNTAKELQDTVKRVNKIEWAVFPEKKIK